MKYDVIESIKPVIINSKHVIVHKDNIASICNLIEETGIRTFSMDDFIDLSDMSEEEKARLFLLLESLNFCFWGESKWKIEYNDKQYSGSIGMLMSLYKALKSGVNVLDFEQMRNISFDNFKKIFEGTCEIPLIEKRYEIFKRTTEKVYLNMNDNFLGEVLKCNSDTELLAFIVDNFNGFRDISVYDGKEVYFFKRATLLVNDLYQNIKSVKDKIKVIDNLRACADYKIPQVLRHNNIFEYKKELAEKIDNKVELLHDSIEEIEIRANMIYVVELIKDEFKNKGINLTSLQIDSALWLLSKNKDCKSKPHHMTETTYY